MEKTERIFKIVTGNIEDYDREKHKDCIYLDEEGDIFAFNGKLYGSTQTRKNFITKLGSELAIYNSRYRVKLIDSFSYKDYKDLKSLIGDMPSLSAIRLDYDVAKELRDDITNKLGPDFSSDPMVIKIESAAFMLGRSGDFASYYYGSWAVMPRVSRVKRLEDKVMQLETKFIQLDKRIKALEEASELKEEK